MPNVSVRELLHEQTLFCSATKMLILRAKQANLIGYKSSERRDLAAGEHSLAEKNLLSLAERDLRRERFHRIPFE